MFQVGDLVRPGETSEIMLVTSVTVNDLVVVRAYGGTTNATLTDDMALLIVGNAALEAPTPQKHASPAASADRTSPRSSARRSR